MPTYLPDITVGSPRRFIDTPNCVLCREDDEAEVEAEVIVNGEPLCRKHADGEVF